MKEETHSVEKNRPKHRVWTEEEILKEALKYKTRQELKKNNYCLFKAAEYRGIWGKVTSHMPKYAYKGKPANNRKWSLEMLQTEALKFKTRADFQRGSPKAYKSAYRRDLLDKICNHMKRANSHNLMWTEEKILQIAKTCTYRSEFKEKYPSAYIAARTRFKILTKCCKHMKYKSTSTPEMEIKDFVRSLCGKADTLKIRNITVPNKPHIKGFDIDVFVPELKKGVEFDGEYYHSLKGLKRARPSWPDEDLKNYHKIKDFYFKESMGIKILHIKEQTWNKDKKTCFNRIKKFLEVAN